MITLATSKTRVIKNDKKLILLIRNKISYIHYTSLIYNNQIQKK